MDVTNVGASSSLLQMFFQDSLATGQNQTTTSTISGSSSSLDSVAISLEAQLLQNQTSDPSSAAATNAQSSDTINATDPNLATITNPSLSSTAAQPHHHHHHHHHGSGSQGSSADPTAGVAQSIAQELLAALGQGTASGQPQAGQATDSDDDGDSSGGTSFVQQLAQGISQDLLAALGQSNQLTQTQTGQASNTNVAGNKAQQVNQIA